MRHKSPSEYIAKYQQEPLGAEQEGRIGELYRPWGDGQYQEAGSVEVQKGDLRLSFDYSAVPDELSATFIERGESDAQFFELLTLDIRDTEKNVERGMDRVLPADFRVFFAPAKIGDSCYVNIAEKRIILSGDITAPRVFVALFHEIGHIYEQRKDKVFAPEKNVAKRWVDVTDVATKVESERDAWAFAFKYLRPFLRRNQDGAGVLPVEDILTWAKNVALHSYSEGAERDAARNHSMAHFAWDYDDGTDDTYWYGGDDEKKDEAEE